MSKENFINSGLLQLYVLGLTSPQEAIMVQKYASSYDDIQNLIDDLKQSLTGYALSNAISPPPN